MIHRRFRDEYGQEWDVITIAKPNAPVTALMKNGWTSFRSRTEVRRITPARNIDNLTDQELRGLLAEAKVYGPARRLIE